MRWRAVALMLLIAVPCRADRLPVYWGTYGGGGTRQAIIEVPGEPQPWTGKPGEVIEGSGYKLISIGKDATSVTLEQVAGERRRLELKVQKESDAAPPSPETTDPVRFPESGGGFEAPVAPPADAPLEPAAEPGAAAPEPPREPPPRRGKWERFIKRPQPLEPSPGAEPAEPDPAKVDVAALLFDGACLPWKGNRGFAALEPYRVQQFPVLAGTAHTVPPSSITLCVIHWVKGYALVQAFGQEIESCGPDSFRVVVPRGPDGTIRNLAGYGTGDDIDVLILNRERR